MKKQIINGFLSLFVILFALWGLLIGVLMLNNQAEKMLYNEIIIGNLEYEVASIKQQSYVFDELVSEVDCQKNLKEERLEVLGFLPGDKEVFTIKIINQGTTCFNFRLSLTNENPFVQICFNDESKNITIYETILKPNEVTYVDLIIEIKQNAPNELQNANIEYMLEIYAEQIMD